MEQSGAEMHKLNGQTSLSIEAIEMTLKETKSVVRFEEFFDQIRKKPTYVILGPQGSGTNFVSRILQRALGFSVTVDRSLIVNSAAALCREPNLARGKAEAKRVVQALFPSAVRKRLLSKRYWNKVENYMGIQDYVHHAYVDSPSDFASFFYCYHAFVNNRTEKGIKSDDIWENLELLPQIIPNYRVLLLVRDPRDNAISIMKKNFGPCEIYYASQYVRKRLDAYVGFADRRPDLALPIRYEDLLVDPLSVAQKIASFVEMPLPEDLTDKVGQIKIRPNRSKKWAALSQRDLAVTETVFRDYLDRFGYQCGADESLDPSQLGLAQRKFIDYRRRIPQKVAVMTRRFVRG